MMKNEKKENIKEAIRNGKIVRSLGGFVITTEQSDKLGSDWIVYSLNDIVVKKDYIEQENPVGTSAENPIIYKEGIPLINNAYYSVDGVIKVWMEEWVDW